MVLSLQSSSVKGSELDTPKPDGLMADGDTSFSEQIFNISVAEVELVVEPDGIGDDIRRESMSLLGIHPAILAISVS